MNCSGLVAPAPVDSWRGRYWQRLEDDGLDPEQILSQALGSRPSQHNRSKLLSLSQCMAEPDLLLRQVRQDYPQACTAKLQRAYLSVIHQDLALSVIAPLTLKLFRDGTVTLPRPSQIFMAPPEQNGQTHTRWFATAGEKEVDEQGFIASMSTLTTDWYPFFRQTLGISPGSYWSSVGLALGAPFAAVWNLAQADATCRLAQDWLKTFQNDANAFVDWIPVSFGEQRTAFPQRRGCCLAHLLRDTSHCGTCGVHRKERMQAASLLARSRS